MLQSDVKPKLLNTLEDFSKRFGADFILLVFPEQSGAHPLEELIFFGKEPMGTWNLATLRDFARNKVTGTEPVLLQKDLISGKADCYLSHIFIPVDLTDSPRCIIILGYTEPVEAIPSAYKSLGNELIYMHVKLLFQQSLQNQHERNAFLLAFGKALGNVRDCKQLFYLMESTLKPFIKYIACTIFELDKENDLMNNLCLDSGSVTPGFPFLDSLKVTAVPFHGLLDSNFNSNVDKQAVDFKKLIENKQISPFLVTEVSPEGKSGQVFNLYNGREVIGNCIFIFEEHYQMDEDLKCLMPLIINQLSNAVINIQSIREIEKKIQERDILQSINTDIAFNKDKLTLLKSLNPKMRLLLNYSHHFVKAINDDQLTVTGLLGDLDSPARFHPDYGHMVSAKFLISDQVFKVLLSNDPIIFDLDEQIATGQPMPLYMSINYECGIRKMAMFSLRVGSKIIGIWVICLLEGQEINAYQMELLKGISRQLSIAAENLKAADIVAKKNKEREFLSRISSDITAIRERKDLDKLFNRTLKDELGFQEAVVMIKNDYGSYHKFLYTPEMYGADPGHDVDFSGERYPLNNAVFCRLMKAEGALVYDMEKILADDDLSVYVKNEYAAGIRTKIGVKLVNYKADVGAVFFNFSIKACPEQEELQLYNNISYHLSTAISNVLLNEEVIKREKERELLFVLSTEIAAIRNGNQLIRLITEKLKGFLGFSYVALGTISDTGEYFDVLQFDPESVCRKHPEYKDMTSMVFPVNDGVINKILMSPVPVSFDLEQLSSKQDLTTYMRISLESGIKHVIGMRFSRDLLPFGSLLFFFENKLVLTHGKSSLIGGLASQISIAVANIKANQELLLSHQQIKIQLQEIQSYKQLLEEEKIYLTEEIETIHNYTEIIGGSTALKGVFKLVSQVSPSDSTVLILGETGTGKELIARAIHNSSPRKNKLMVKVNCAALPANLIESELFGHERGSFTGATERRLGKFELANNGTLFLDEIGEMPVDLQVKLLRALQEREIERVGGKETIKVNVRIIAATNRDLEKEISEGRFRTDLYYRLNIFPISLPPLRDRKQDIEQLSMHFIKQFNKNFGKNIDSISSKAIQQLMEYDWPGNIRELEHLIERSVLLTTGNMLKQLLLPAPEEQLAFKAEIEEFSLKTIDENEKDYILKVLKHCRGRIAGSGGAAHILGVPPTTLNSKIKRLGIKREHIV